jgi:hypothetical protein
MFRGLDIARLAVLTLLDLMKGPDTSPNTIDVLKSDLAQAPATAEELRQLPEVGRVLTLQSFIALPLLLGVGVAFKIYYIIA